MRISNATVIILVWAIYTGTINTPHGMTGRGNYETSYEASLGEHLSAIPASHSRTYRPVTNGPGQNLFVVEELSALYS